MFLQKVLAVCGLILLGPAIALGHPAPFSYLDIHIGDHEIRGSLAVHSFDVGHELGIDPPERVLDPAIAESIRARLTALLTPRFTIRTDRVLSPEWQGIEVLTDQSEVRLHFRITIDRPATVSVRARMFPYDPVHQTFLNVYED